MTNLVNHCNHTLELVKRILLDDSHFEIQKLFGRLDKKWIKLWFDIILVKTEMIETHLGEVDQRQSRLSQGIGGTGGLPMIVL